MQLYLLRRHVHSLPLPISSEQGTNKPGTRNEEMGNDGNIKREMKKCFITACPLCIQQHLLERTSATGDSGEEVEHMHDQLNTQKVQDGQNLFMCSIS